MIADVVLVDAAEDAAGVVGGPERRRQLQLQLERVEQLDELDVLVGHSGHVLAELVEMSLIQEEVHHETRLPRLLVVSAVVLALVMHLE